ncbi:prosaposin-like isoform X1 [Phoenix dactylifera]|uniref:Pulmonary surfactant-associated protein B n=1 Tax=Phoenix dactylifera TaxID=42345 RepID=A0A8B7MWR1_PHODC|nr:prosaposin-like isoform X1 [Phoenix dactylifera]XP_026666163.2 prosaposin-like isoform X1 [Phoenix dactylifera]
MGLRKEFLLLLILVVSWSNADARSLVTFDVTVSPVVVEAPRHENKISEAVLRDDQLCAMCENFTAQAAYFLGENKTQTEIIETLHQACSQLQPFEQQCILLVDYYASLFFGEITNIRPEEFCTKVNLCEKMVAVNLQKSEETCTLCHRVVAEITTKLKDPDAEFEIVKMLMKECNKMDHYGQECKKLVFRYVPLILVNGEKFLETTDVCASIHACEASQENVVGTGLLVETSFE